MVDIQRYSTIETLSKAIPRTDPYTHFVMDAFLSPHMYKGVLLNFPYKEDMSGTATCKSVTISIPKEHHDGIAEGMSWFWNYMLSYFSAPVVYKAINKLCDLNKVPLSQPQIVLTHENAGAYHSAESLGNGELVRLVVFLHNNSLAAGMTLINKRTQECDYIDFMPNRGILWPVTADTVFAYKQEKQTDRRTMTIIYAKKE